MQLPAGLRHPAVCRNRAVYGRRGNNCPNDCISGSGGSVCGNGLCEGGDGEDCIGCPADCNGLQTGKPSGRFCCGATEGCGDSRCTESAWDCTMVPQGTPYCCGDGTCEGTEDGNNCAIDCACQTPADCNDGVGDANCPDDGLFCNGTEFCDAATDCGSTGDPCGSGENCNEPTDTCDPCTPKKGACSANEECCSGVCKANGTCR